MMNVGLSRFLANSVAGVLPSISAKISYQFWTRTRHTQRRAVEQFCLQSAEKSTLSFGHEEVVVYSWGDGPKVLLLHGWNGRATQFFKFIEHLIAHGYGVLAFDAPGHGDSSGNHTSLKQIVQVVEKLFSDYGEFEATIAHSFGFIVAVNALKIGFQSKALIGVSSPSDYNLLLQSYIINFGLNSKAERAFLELLKKNHQLSSFDELSIHYLAKALTLPCLVVHDENDRQVPIAEAHKIVDSWSGAELYTTNGRGHSRILYNQDVIDRCIAFLDRPKLC